MCRELTADELAEKHMAKLFVVKQPLSNQRHTITEAIKVPAHVQRWIVLDVLSGIVGVVGGLGAIAFRLIIDLNSRLFFDFILPRVSVDIGGLNSGIILLPALGGLIIGPIIMRFAPETKGHGVPEVMEAVALKGGRIRKIVAFLKVIVSSITIGSGGSAGREGPIA
jgi:CIC family chloride channel protein